MEANQQIIDKQLVNTFRPIVRIYGIAVTAYMPLALVSAPFNPLSLLIACIILALLIAGMDWFFYDFLNHSPIAIVVFNVLVHLAAALFVATLLAAIVYDLRTRNDHPLLPPNPYRLTTKLNLVSLHSTIKPFSWRVRLFARRHGAYLLFPQTQSLRVMCN